MEPFDFIAIWNAFTLWSVWEEAVPPGQTFLSSLSCGAASVLWVSLLWEIKGATSKMLQMLSLCLAMFSPILPHPFSKPGCEVPSVHTCAQWSKSCMATVNALSSQIVYHKHWMVRSDPCLFLPPSSLTIRSMQVRIIVPKRCCY